MKKLIILSALALNFAFGVMAVNAMGAYKSGDYKLAAQIWQSECGNGDADGCGMLAILYHEGKGVKQDKKIAREYFEKTCKLGKKVACEEAKRLKDEGF